ncbi:MAG: hypothetical protein JXA67_09800 [Micromonosporaceae bacterium]|nr:hypothetical protein [Micromonosporaceae bacterium]
MLMANSEVEAIAADIAQALNAVVQAEQQVLGTAQHASETSSRAAATGLVGVAAAMGGVRNEIAAIREIIANAAALGQAAGHAVRNVGDQMSPEEANTHFTTSIQKLDAMRDALFTAAQQVNNAKGRVEATLRGGQPCPMLVRLDGVRQYLVMAAQRSDAAKARITATIQKTGQLGN